MSFLSISDHQPSIQKFPGAAIKFQEISSISRNGISNSSRFTRCPEVVDTPWWQHWRWMMGCQRFCCISDNKTCQRLLRHIAAVTHLSTPPMSLRKYEWNDRNFIGGSAFARYSSSYGCQQTHTLQSPTVYSVNQKILSPHSFLNFFSATAENF